MIRDVLYWKHSQINVEENSGGKNKGYVNYVILVGDYEIVIVAKKPDRLSQIQQKRRNLNYRDIY
jgi:hypothetical protein